MWSLKALIFLFSQQRWAYTQRACQHNISHFSIRASKNLCQNTAINMTQTYLTCVRLMSMSIIKSVMWFALKAIPDFFLNKTFIEPCIAPRWLWVRSSYVILLYRHAELEHGAYRKRSLETHVEANSNVRYELMLVKLSFCDHIGCRVIIR